jgi:hypothetical protein
MPFPPETYVLQETARTIVLRSEAGEVGRRPLTLEPDERADLRL